MALAYPSHRRQLLPARDKATPFLEVADFSGGASGVHVQGGTFSFPIVADLVGLHTCRHLLPTEISEEPIVQHLGNAYEAEGKNRSKAISRIMEAFDSERGQLLRPLLPFDDGRLPWKSSDLKVTS